LRRRNTEIVFDKCAWLVRNTVSITAPAELGIESMRV